MLEYPFSLLPLKQKIPKKFKEPKWHKHTKNSFLWRGQSLSGSVSFLGPLVEGAGLTRLPFLCLLSAIKLGIS